MKKLLLIPALCVVCFGCSCGNSNNNTMAVESQENSPDWKITTKVKAEILSDTTISASARFVSVNTTDGVVTLSGSVPTKADRKKIVKIAEKVSGVVKVVDEMTISNN